MDATQSGVASRGNRRSSTAPTDLVRVMESETETGRAPDRAVDVTAVPK